MGKIVNVVGGTVLMFVTVVLIVPFAVELFVPDWPPIQKQFVYFISMILAWTYLKPNFPKLGRSHK
jgi:hypothetical protein